MPFVQVAAASAVALLALPAEALALTAVKPQHGQLRGGGQSSIVLMRNFRRDCGKSSGFSFMQNPGAGMSPEAIQPFTKVLKDGFQSVDCIKDYMFEHGDKFGDNKASYKLGDLTNVSIVHYAAHVPREDREEMTHEVCFRFCRTVPEMVFFGLTNGRECYCTPYYEAEASDSSSCDAVCDGDKGTMCGGKTKSSMFAMHQCSNTAQQLTQTAAAMGDVADALDEVVSFATSAADALQGSGSNYQDAFGEAGDPGASDLMQSAKAFAGDLEEQLRGANKLLAHVSELSTKSQAAAGGDLSDAKALRQAEELVRSMQEAATEAEKATEELQDITQAMADVSGDKAGDAAAKQYYPAMYFVDKKFDKAPATCTGEASEKPLVATLDGCARACDNDLHECVGFSFFGSNIQEEQQQEGVSGGLCFLFSKLKTVRYYTNCGQQYEDDHVQCFAKLSKFEGTTIKPNPSGKCDNCLKEAKQADRCFH